MLVSRKRDLDKNGRYRHCQWAKTNTPCAACDRMQADFEATGKLALRENVDEGGVSDKRR